jgi:serine/threonine protein phosphatase PrpC
VEGAVLLCSDGLWNYEQDAAALADRALPVALTDPLRAAGDLVKFAIDAGGSDNITVVLIPFPPRQALSPSADGSPPDISGEPATRRADQGEAPR